MKSKEEFNSYSEKEIKPIVVALEAKRLGIAERFSYKKYWRNLKWMALIAVGLTISIEVFSFVPEQLRGAIPLTFMYALFAPLYIFIRRNLSFDPINQEYKQKVIPKIISFFGNTLTYSAKDGITMKEFNASNLFTLPTGLEAEDLVTGHIDGAEVRMSDVKCIQRHQRNRTSKTDSTIIFFGLYAIAKLNKNIPSQVILKSSNVIVNAINDLASSLLGSPLIGKIHDQPETIVIKTGNEEFDKRYTVKCSDESVAKSLLTPAFIQLVMAFQKEFIKPVDFSFFENQVHLAFHGVNLFEADAHKSFTEKDISLEYFGYINMTMGITEAVGI